MKNETAQTIQSPPGNVNTSIELQCVNFHGDALAVIERAGKYYVAMKPIVEALGLAWNKQYELIKRDAVLSEVGIPIAGIPSAGGLQEVFCLPLEFLNGWLFKLNANRYRGKRRGTIIAYQRECYLALFSYWHNGAAINPRANAEQIDALKVQLARAEKLAASFAPQEKWGQLSPKTGRPRTQPVRGYIRSPRGATTRLRDSQIELVQQLFSFEKQRLSA